jgi:AGZA family xanthine/uracil permease-like MFS transporter
MAFALIAGHRLPFNMPGAILAIVAGTVLYYVLAIAGAGDGYVVRAAPELVPALPSPTLSGAFAMFGEVTNYLGIIFPFALLIAASAVNVTAGARITGDEFDAGRVVRLDAAATAISALCGGVVQTTPYFGHATYKRMGARTGYALGASAVITIGGFLGAIAFASQMIPEAVLKPILVVVACDILRLAFSGGDIRHAPALLFATVPAILNYAHTKVSDLYGRVQDVAAQALGPDWTAGYLLLGAMARGYILTSLIWGALVVWIIDRKMTRAALAALAAAVCTEFGVIHSVMPTSEMYLPWAIPDLGGLEVLPHRLAAGYLVAAVMLYSAGFIRNKPVD